MVVTFVEQLDALVESGPDEPMLTFEGAVLSRSEIVARSRDLARELADRGVEVDDMVTIAEPNSPQFITAMVACWMVGAVPQPVSSRLPSAELEAIVELADSRVVIGLDVEGRSCLPSGYVAPSGGEPLELHDAAMASSWKAPTSGGSTGRPKLILAGDPPVWSEGLEGSAHTLGARPGWTMVMPGPLYHNGPLVWACLALLNGAHLALLPRFDAEATLATIQETRAESIYIVPTMMQRIWKLPEQQRSRYDLSSLQVLFHLAEPCPTWLKQAWIDWLGPDVVWELYAATEGQAGTVISGHEWLEHPGSVGKPAEGTIRVLDAGGAECPAGVVGEVWLRSGNRDRPSYRYIGAEAESRDGWDCLGDMGYTDADGYLYLTDRRADMILVGGENVYPAEIEAALNEHPAVASCAVIGLPDPDKGNRVHAVVQADGVAADELAAFLAPSLVRYKIPTSYEFVDQSLRDDAGKVRRRALRDERVQQI